MASGRSSRSTKTQCEIITPKTYARLTEEERYQIYEGVTEKRSHREIAILINKHHSTVSNEVKRNTGLRSYRPKQAQEKVHHRYQSKPRHRELTADAQSLIAENIKHEWSPDQIQGRLRREGLPMVCATTIYGFIQKSLWRRSLQAPSSQKILQKTHRPTRR